MGGGLSWGLLPQALVLPWHGRVRGFAHSQWGCTTLVPSVLGSAVVPTLSSPQLPIVASSIVTLYFLELTDLFKPAKVGFQCYDRALSMPYVETNEELIPLLMLLSLAFAAPAASVCPGAHPAAGG